MAFLVIRAGHIFHVHRSDGRGSSSGIFMEIAGAMGSVFDGLQTLLDHTPYDRRHDLVWTNLFGCQHVENKICL